MQFVSTFGSTWQALAADLGMSTVTLSSKERIQLE